LIDDSPDDRLPELDQIHLASGIAKGWSGNEAQRGG
jgi:hypothetical protein